MGSEGFGTILIRRKGENEMSVDLDRMPKLGFGLMRLPEQDGKIDLEQVCRMVDAYMESGMNYFDSAYVYHGGNSEKIIKEAIANRYPRDAFMVATKLPAWCMSNEADRDRIFNEQLERCGVDYFDFYLLHSVEDGGNGETYDRLNCWDWAMQKKAEGKIRHFGFSFHGSPAYLEKTLDAHPEVEFVQIQLNYADWENPVVRSGKLYEILHSRNIPMIIMEPVKGGTLAALKPELEEMYRAVRPSASVASWALRFVGSLPGVMTILSGMSNEEQMNDNISTFSDFEPLSDDADNFDTDTGELLLGDIVLSYDKILEQAESYGHSIKREYAFLIVHSLLHLLGYDHIEEKDRRLMEERQERLMEILGISR